MRGREIEIELGAQQQLRRRLFFSPGLSSCGYTFLRSLRTHDKMDSFDWASTYLYTSIEGSNMYSTEQCVDLIIVLFVLLYTQINKWPEKMITELPPILFSHRLWTAQGTWWFVAWSQRFFLIFPLLTKRRLVFTASRLSHAEKNPGKPLGPGKMVFIILLINISFFYRAP